MTEEQITLLAAIIGGGLGLVTAILSLVTTLYGVVHQARIEKTIRRIYPFVSYKIAKLAVFESTQKGMLYRFYKFYDKNKVKTDDKFLFVHFKNLDNYKIMDLKVCFAFFRDGKYYGLGSLYANKDIVVAFLYSDIAQYLSTQEHLSCQIQYRSEANEKLMFVIEMSFDEQGRMLNDRKDTMYWGKNYKKNSVVLNGLEISVSERFEKEE